MKKDEYIGLVARRFPGQQKPRPWMFEPRREQKESIVKATHQPQLHSYVSGASNDGSVQLDKTIRIKVKPYQCLNLEDVEEIETSRQSQERKVFKSKEKNEVVIDLPTISI